MNKLSKSQQEIKQELLTEYGEIIFREKQLIRQMNELIERKNILFTKCRGCGIILKDEQYILTK